MRLDVYWCRTATTAAALQICANAVTPPTPNVDVVGLPFQSVKFAVDWPTFLRRHDMLWRWNSSEATWPSSFETAAWTGNGVYGLAPLVDGPNVLRFEIARSDVWQCGNDPRLPIGYLRLTLAGAMREGEMNQSLASGAVTGRVTTSAGALSWKVYTPATARLSVLEWSAVGGESAATLALVNEQAIGRA
jgi:hypothetical protein